MRKMILSAALCCTTLSLACAALDTAKIDELTGRTMQESLTLVPLSIYFRDGRAKVELALARGRRRYDKRQAIARRDADREAARAMARARRRS